MAIQQNKVVTIDYTLKDDEGNVLDTSEGRESLAYLHGASNIIIGLENALEGKSPGESLSVVIPPEEGYG
ncbi:MAG: peptidylprolyl isomerase, partial [Aliifodinibius sp.]|nr:peptidylprolyl isomerase [Candidatus Saccharibacteria bacterium]NIT59174.1 peptidylprolyl isomerase [Fodinibius sp.]NIV13958.1 peptidylprolyl isomerase [Fodinibius sp.]NIY27757.1 peptidylprolyl isomerase [Fodinibius sp.]